MKIVMTIEEAQARLNVLTQLLVRGGVGRHNFNVGYAIAGKPLSALVDYDILKGIPLTFDVGNLRCEHSVVSMVELRQEATYKMEAKAILELIDWLNANWWKGIPRTEAMKNTMLFIENHCIYPTKEVHDEHGFAELKRLNEETKTQERKI